jgi:hypothetical protein
VSAAIRLEVAAEKVAEMSDTTLNLYSDADELWRLAYRVGVPSEKLGFLILRERLSRGLVKLADLPHRQRRLLVKDNLDLHAIAAGPIMDIGQIYLPAGKLSMEETRRREQGNILPDDAA